MRFDQPAHDRRDGIAAIGEAEQDFVSRIVERESRGERFFGERIDSAQRPHDADRRRAGARAASARARLAHREMAIKALSIWIEMARRQ